MGLILASSSPRRREIIAHLQMPFRVQSADIDETPHDGEAPQAMVARLSRTKAEGVARASQPNGDIVLAADTTVALDGRIIGKPNDAADAEAILKSLRGRAHQVFTGITLTPSPSPLLGEGSIGWSSICETRVYMRNYSDDELRAYIASGSVFDKAGAYGIQEPLFHPVMRIAGCYLNVMGLPLCEVIRGLRALGIAVDNSEPFAHDCIGSQGEPCVISNFKPFAPR